MAGGADERSRPRQGRQTYGSADVRDHATRAGHILPPSDYCPVSVGANLLGDRWTLLIVRELLSGASRFNDIHRGLPGLARSILAARLRHLEHLGLLQRVPVRPGSQRADYLLTPAGTSLSGVIQALGEWALEWRFPAPTDEGSDAAMVLWRLHQSLNRAALPRGMIGIEFRFSTGPHPRGWIHVGERGSTVCLGSAERDVDLAVTVAPRVLNELRMGLRACEETVECGDISFEGPPRLARDFRHWFSRSPFADRLERLHAGQS